MKKTLILLALLLPGAGAFAQEYAGTSTVTRTVPTGVTREEQAPQHLTATSAIASGAAAHYTAGQSVTLQPGFVAQAGSVFRALISPINNGSSSEPGATLTVRAFPNPLETTTTVEYNLPEAFRVTHTLTDASGRLIRRAEGHAVESAGTHHAPLDLSRLPVGIYLYQVETVSGSKVLRLMKK